MTYDEKRAALKASGIKPGDRLSYWYDAGTGPEAVTCEVVKVGQFKVRVRDEGTGRQHWKYPHFFINAKRA